MSFKKLHFNSDVTYREELLYKKGEVKDVDNSLGYADKWIRRGVATVVEFQTPPPFTQPTPMKSKNQKIYAGKKKTKDEEDEEEKEEVDL